MVLQRNKLLQENKSHGKTLTLVRYKRKKEYGQVSTVVHYFDNLIRSAFYAQVNVTKIRFLSKFELKKAFSVAFTLEMVPYVIGSSHI